MMSKPITGVRTVPARWGTAFAAIACALLLLGSSAVLAQQDDAKRIRDELVLVQQEQQSVFQQFQMVRELRHGLESPPPPPPALTMNDPNQSYSQSPPNYYDQVAAQQDRAQKLIYYGQEMDRLFAQYQELEGRRKALLEDLSRLPGRR
jgi:hypothetical protein